MESLGYTGFVARMKGESLEDIILQRLLALTPSLHPLVGSLALAASHDMTMLLTGETGTGKTYLARLIHEFSSRKDHRFLAVPCGALSNFLVESELFGHVKGPSPAPTGPSWVDSRQRTRARCSSTRSTLWVCNNKPSCSG